MFDSTELRLQRSLTMVVRSDWNGRKKRMSDGGKAEEFFHTCYQSIDLQSDPDRIG
jgi:hypothetical protein